MILKQFYLGCLAHASYLIIDERTKVAAVIDPQRDVDQYLDEAERLGATIRYVILTHFHADFIAGHLELRDCLGARIYLGQRAQAEYDYAPLKDGDLLEFGDVRLRVLETPGHTPEGISIVAYDLEENDTEPNAVFTGDTLFIGDVGRPDLLASIGVTADELGGMLYDSLHDKLMKLPDETIVYPAHGAGSMCGKNIGKETSSTIGEQRRFNYALQPMTKEEFVALVTAEQPEPPAYFIHDAIQNRKERKTLEENIQDVMQPLALEKVLRLSSNGAQLVDVRSAADFAGAHLIHSLNIGLDGKYATWAGTVLDRMNPVVLIAEPGTEREAAIRLGRIGLDDVAGYLQGGMGALSDRPELVATVDRITVQNLHDLRDPGDEPVVLDVRTSPEWEAGHVNGSVNIPLAQLEIRFKDVPDGSPVNVICRSGYRSSLACSLLKRSGRTQVRDVVGGFEAWKSSGLPIVEPVA